MNEYTYRKEFGLTQTEFEDEPYETYVTNAMILGIMSKHEREMEEKQKRKMKRGSKQH